MHPTFTYRHSDLPPVRPEIKAEIVALECQISDLILKIQGNYRELDELAEALGTSFYSCQLSLQSIRIIADSEPVPATPTLTNLPIEEKELVYSLSFTNSVLLNLLSVMTGKTMETLAQEVTRISSYHQRPTTKDVEDFMVELLSAPKDMKDGFVLRKM